MWVTVVSACEGARDCEGRHEYTGSRLAPQLLLLTLNLPDLGAYGIMMRVDEETMLGWRWGSGAKV